VAKAEGQSEAQLPSSTERASSKALALRPVFPTMPPRLRRRGSSWSAGAVASAISARNSGSSTASCASCSALK